MEILARIPVVYLILSLIQQAMGFFVCKPKDYKWLYSSLLASVPKTLHGECLSPG